MYSIALSAILLIMASSVEAGWVNMNTKLTGRVIHVESLRSRGKWFGAANPSGLILVGSPERLVYYRSWSQFAVRKCDSGTVCLESMKYRDHYIDAHHSGWAKITRSNHVVNQKWAQWRIECLNAKKDECRFFAVRWGNQNKYLDSHHSGHVAVSDYGAGWSRFRILSPRPRASWVAVTTLKNNGNTVVEKTVTYTVGVDNSQKNTVSNTISASLTAEIEGVFSTGLETSTTWTRETSTTFKKSKGYSIKISVKPHTKVNFMQLVGYYGPFVIHAQSWKNDCHDLKTNAPCSKDQTMEGYEINDPLVHINKREDLEEINERDETVNDERIEENSRDETSKEIGSNRKEEEIEKWEDDESLNGDDYNEDEDEDSEE